MLTIAVKQSSDSKARSCSFIQIHKTMAIWMLRFGETKKKSMIGSRPR